MKLRKLVPKLLGAFVLGAILSVGSDRAIVDALMQTISAKTAEMVSEWRSQAIAQFDDWVREGKASLLKAVEDKVQELTQ
ncbi:MAG: hypothetical protein WCD18_24690 [Thermosynechococcaceae cyanobacterium]